MTPIALEQINATWGSTGPTRGLGDHCGAIQETKAPKVKVDYSHLAGD